jgi:N-acyl-D-aspartate/D-glutamate deacylase
MSAKTLISGGTVVDGTGAAARVADVLIEGDMIAAVGVDLAPGTDTTIIDATDRIVCPGFVDHHSHADFTLVAFPSADSALRQGITTVAVGNCGGGVAPATDRWDVRKVAFAYSSEWGVDIDWSRFGEYTSHLDGAAVNVAPLVPHGAIRNAVLGLGPREATLQELQQMVRLLHEALDDGAFGMSTGLQYLPGSWASRREIRTLVEIVGARGRTYATHMRNRADYFADSTREALAAADGTGAHLQLSHFAPRPYAPPEQVDAAFELVAAAVDDGGRVGIDTFPEIWGPALLVDLFPAEIMSGTGPEVLARLADESWRASIEEYFEKGSAFLVRVAGYEEIYVSGLPDPAGRVGRSLRELAEAAGISVGRVSTELLLEAGELFRTVGIRHIYATEHDLRRTLRLPYCSIESDGIVTPGEGDECPLSWNASSYGYTARVLEHYVRDQGFLALEDAVHKMTQLPARALGLRSRGVLASGNYADIVIFDRDNISDMTTPDDMARHPRGIDAVLVNGEMAFRDGRQADPRGMLLSP